MNKFSSSGPIETQFERYTADVVIEARWLADSEISLIAEGT